jgi:hypothetical protein
MYNDKFGYHEVIHTTHVIFCMWDDHILGHGVVDLNVHGMKEKE